jgi:hypothetical protein
MSSLNDSYSGAVDLSEGKRVFFLQLAERTDAQLSQVNVRKAARLNYCEVWDHCFLVSDTMEFFFFGHWIFSINC